MSKLVFNSIAVERRNNNKVIDLFAGCGGLDKAMASTWKYATIHVTKETSESL
jgi:site-specific DNA-cytosine methylase